MKLITILLIMLLSGSHALAAEFDKKSLQRQAETNVINGFCSDKKFLSCTAENEKICNVKLNTVIFPKCAKAVFENAPDTLTIEDGKRAARVFSECAADSYIELSNINKKVFAACMTSP